MNLFGFFRPAASAPVARERLQILLEYERKLGSQIDLFNVLREEILRGGQPARQRGPRQGPDHGGSRPQILDARRRYRDPQHRWKVRAQGWRQPPTLVVAAMWQIEVLPFRSFR